MTDHIATAKTYLLDPQDRIYAAFEAEDGKARLAEDIRERPAGGGGWMRIIGDDALIEKDGVNFSHVFGDNLPPPISAHRPELAGCGSQALGVSLMIHPENPYVPTSYANVCFFCAEKEGEEPVWWFGGGFDLTPYYAHEEDCVHWHQAAHDACAPPSAGVYPRYKEQCGHYFHLKHRNEPRGVDGLFFDDLDQRDLDICFAFVRAIGNAYIDACLSTVQHRKHMSFDKRQREFQTYRHGRYVEFNLVFDRGTLFDLQSGGRTKSIPMSLPPQARWGYDWKSEPDSKEARLTRYFLADRDWLAGQP